MMYARFLYEWDSIACLTPVRTNSALRDSRLSLSTLEHVLDSFA